MKSTSWLMQNSLTTYNMLQNLLDHRAHDHGHSIFVDKIWGCVSHQVSNALRKKKLCFCIKNTIPPKYSFIKVIK